MTNLLIQILTILTVANLERFIRSGLSANRRLAVAEEILASARRPEEEEEEGGEWAASTKRLPQIIMHPCGVVEGHPSLPAAQRMA